MKKHLVLVQDIFNKNALILSRKGNLFCNALKNQRKLGFPAASFFTHPLLALHSWTRSLQSTWKWDFRDCTDKHT